MQRSFSKDDVTGLGFQSPVLAAEWAGARRGGQADRHKKALARCPRYSAPASGDQGRGKVD